MKYLLVSSILLAANVCLALTMPIKATRSDCERHNFEISWEIKAPDGFARPMILINDQSPGPVIHIKEGDCVEVGIIACSWLILGTNLMFNTRSTSKIICNGGLLSISMAFSKSGESVNSLTISDFCIDSRVHLGRTASQASRRNWSTVEQPSHIDGPRHNMGHTGEKIALGWAIKLTVWKVPCTRSRTNHGWIIWCYHYRVRAVSYWNVYTNSYRSPAPKNQKPFSMITNDAKELKQLEKAELDPEIVMLSDWTHMTSEEIRDVAVTANLDTMSVFHNAGRRY